MAGQSIADSVTAELDALQTELRELHAASRRAVQDRESQDSECSAMVVRGK